VGSLFVARWIFLQTRRKDEFKELCRLKGKATIEFHNIYRSAEQRLTNLYVFYSSKKKIDSLFDSDGHLIEDLDEYEGVYKQYNDSLNKIESDKESHKTNVINLIGTLTEIQGYVRRNELESFIKYVDSIKDMKFTVLGKELADDDANLTSIGLVKFIRGKLDPTLGKATKELLAIIDDLVKALSRLR
jgi:hypothetical protein